MPWQRTPLYIDSGARLDSFADVNKMGTSCQMEAAMGAATERHMEAEDALQRRVEDLVAAHGGDPRAVIETLLLVNDARAAATSYGYVRGRAAGAAVLDHGR